MNTSIKLAAASLTALTMSAFAGQVRLDIADVEGAGGTVVNTFNLFDHPGSLVDPNAYGLRLDSFTSDAPVTFSFENGSGQSQVQLNVIDTGSGLQINIQGLVHGNSALGGSDYGTFMLDLTYSVDATGNGWEDMNMEDGEFVGGLTGVSTTGDSPLGNGEFLDLFAMSDGSDTFRFLADGFRLDGDTTSWVGRGWVSPEGGGAGFNDLLFTAVSVIPLPPAAYAGLGMLTGLGVYRRVRRRS